jgi:hypothetical protein
MPEWVNWSAAVTGILGFVFSICIFFLESRTRQRLATASEDLHQARQSFIQNEAVLKETQRNLEATEQALDERVSHLEKMSAYANVGKLKVHP